MIAKKLTTCAECGVDVSETGPGRILGLRYCHNCLRSHDNDLKGKRKPIHKSLYEERYSVELIGQERKALNDPYLPYVRE